LLSCSIILLIAKEEYYSISGVNVSRGDELTLFSVAIRWKLEGNEKQGHQRCILPLLLPLLPISNSQQIITSKS
jgi:hypothetical protein